MVKTLFLLIINIDTFLAQHVPSPYRGEIVPMYENDDCRDVGINSKMVHSRNQEGNSIIKCKGVAMGKRVEIPPKQKNVLEKNGIISECSILITKNKNKKFQFFYLICHQKV